jgi:ketosteroid isomerase-like protein
MDGEWRGREAVLEAMQRNFALVENQQPQVEQMISQDNAVVLLLRERGVLKSDGRRYDVRCVQWFQFAGGKIQSIDEIVASEPVTV